MFGTGRRRILTGEHVEVWREAAAAGERLPFFRKRFVAQRGSNAIDWNLREALLILTLDELGSAHLQQFDSTSNSQDRTQRDLRTQHAGPSLQNWLDLPVERDGRRLAHAFHDCAHWFALARYGLTALRDINRAGVLHLDIKPDNICIPPDPAIVDPRSGDRFSVDVARLRLIDFAFSLWESKLPLGRALGMGIYEGTEYQSRQLRSAIVAGERGDLEPIRHLDWRADLYGLGWTLEFILQDLPPLGAEGAPGWNAQRLDEARALIRHLLSFDERWRDHPGAALPAPPHRELIERVDDMLAAGDLQRSLETPWHIKQDEAWKSRELATPLTVPAVDLRVADAVHPRPPESTPGTTLEPAPEPALEPAPESTPLAALEGAAGSPMPPPRAARHGRVGVALALMAAVCAVAWLLLSSRLEGAREQKPAASAEVAAPAPDASIPATKPPGAAGETPAPRPAVKDAPVASASPPPSAPEPAPRSATTQPPLGVAELGERLAGSLRDSPSSRYAAVLAAASAGQDSFADIQRAAADKLAEGWNAAALGDGNRVANLRALLWLQAQLPQGSRQQTKAALGARYWWVAAAEGNREWWRHKAAPDAEGRAWLAEAQQLAGAGVRQAQHTLAHAYALGLGVPQNSAAAGQNLSLALGGITADGLHAARAWRAAHAGEAGHDANPAAADAVIADLALKLVSWKALSSADRRFSIAAIPGLKHLADLGDPAAATMLGDIYACRVDPPMKREARLAYGEAQKDPAWAKVIPRRIADVLDGHACIFRLSRQAKTR